MPLVLSDMTRTQALHTISTRTILFPYALDLVPAVNSNALDLGDKRITNLATSCELHLYIDSLLYYRIDMNVSMQQ